MARKYLESALKTDPNCIEVIFVMVQLNISEQKYEDAIEMLKGRINSDEKYADILHVHLGDIYLCLKQYSEAIIHYRKALLINPNHQGARQGLERVNKIVTPNHDDDDDEDGEEEDEEDDELDDELEDGDSYLNNDTFEDSSDLFNTSSIDDFDDSFN
eukprot:TRINITY_DN6505_c0_g1_i1.p1 TRINITY_DN6505_c0_g1~~TRINITY_DN6505_c0_g1_i1.p1  ORF type:complete len:158 (+),score=78.89 TRINITY_DN6505_c0_g1_i1:369-842(+)